MAIKEETSYDQMNGGGWTSRYVRVALGIPVQIVPFDPNRVSLRIMCHTTHLVTLGRSENDVAAASPSNTAPEAGFVFSRMIDGDVVSGPIWIWDATGAMTVAVFEAFTCPCNRGSRVRG